MDCLRLSTEKNIEENSRGRKWLAFVFLFAAVDVLLLYTAQLA